MAHNEQIATDLAKRTDVSQVHNVSAGTKENWSKATNGQLDPTTMDRNWYQQGCVNKCGNAGDDAGHLIASSLGGAGDRINLVPQASTLNRGEWRDMERFFAAELKAGKDVSIKIDVGYPAGGGARPSEFTVVAYIGGKPKTFEFKQ